MDLLTQRIEQSLRLAPSAPYPVPNACHVGGPAGHGGGDADDTADRHWIGLYRMLDAGAPVWAGAKTAHRDLCALLAAGANGGEKRKRTTPPGPPQPPLAPEEEEEEEEGAAPPETKRVRVDPTEPPALPPPLLRLEDMPAELLVRFLTDALSLDAKTDLPHLGRPLREQLGMPEGPYSEMPRRPRPANLNELLDWRGRRFERRGIGLSAVAFETVSEAVATFLGLYLLPALRPILDDLAFRRTVWARSFGWGRMDITLNPRSVSSGPTTFGSRLPPLSAAEGGYGDGPKWYTHGLLGSIVLGRVLQASAENVRYLRRLMATTTEFFERNPTITTIMQSEAFLSGQPVEFSVEQRRALRQVVSISTPTEPRFFRRYSDAWFGPMLWAGFLRLDFVPRRVLDPDQSAYPDAARRFLAAAGQAAIEERVPFVVPIYKPVVRMLGYFPHHIPGNLQRAGAGITVHGVRPAVQPERGIQEEGHSVGAYPPPVGVRLSIYDDGGDIFAAAMLTRWVMSDVRIDSPAPLLAFANHASTLELSHVFPAGSAFLGPIGGGSTGNRMWPEIAYGFRGMTLDDGETPPIARDGPEAWTTWVWGHPNEYKPQTSKIFHWIRCWFPRGPAELEVALPPKLRERTDALGYPYEFTHPKLYDTQRDVWQLFLNGPAMWALNVVQCRGLALPSDMGSLMAPHLRFSAYLYPRLNGATGQWEVDEEATRRAGLITRMRALPEAAFYLQGVTLARSAMEPPGAEEFALHPWTSNLSIRVAYGSYHEAIARARELAYNAAAAKLTDQGLVPTARNVREVLFTQMERQFATRLAAAAGKLSESIRDLVVSTYVDPRRNQIPVGTIVANTEMWWRSVLQLTHTVRESKRQGVSDADVVATVEAALKHKHAAEQAPTPVLQHLARTARRLYESNLTKVRREIADIERGATFQRGSATVVEAERRRDAAFAEQKETIRMALRWPIIVRDMTGVRAWEQRGNNTREAPGRVLQWSDIRLADGFSPVDVESPESQLLPEQRGGSAEGAAMLPGFVSLLPRFAERVYTDAEMADATSAFEPMWHWFHSVYELSTRERAIAAAAGGTILRPNPQIEYAWPYGSPTEAQDVQLRLVVRGLGDDWVGNAMFADDFASEAAGDPDSYVYLDLASNAIGAGNDKVTRDTIWALNRIGAYKHFKIRLAGNPIATLLARLAQAALPSFEFLMLKTDDDQQTRALERVQPFILEKISASPDLWPHVQQFAPDQATIDALMSMITRIAAARAYNNPNLTPIVQEYVPPSQIPPRTLPFSIDRRINLDVPLDARFGIAPNLLPPTRPDATMIALTGRERAELSSE